MPKITGMNGHAFVIDPEGATKLISDEPFSLDDLQGLVGGLIEVVPGQPHEVQIIVNEEGRLLGLRPNILASLIARDALVGTAVVLTGDYRLK